MKRRYLDPKNDIPFRMVFRENPDLLKSFLNAEMPFEENQYVENIEYLSIEYVPDNPAKRDSIIYADCRDNAGKRFIVEIQICWIAPYLDYLVLNESRTYIRQLKLSEDYSLAQPVYSLIIMNDVFDKGSIDYYHHYKTINRKDELIEGLEYVIIELPKFKSTMVEKKMTVLWLRFLQEVKHAYFEPDPELMENEDICKAIGLCDCGLFSPMEMDAYDRCWDVIRTLNAVRKTEFNEGRQEGLTEGRQEGLAIAREKRRQEAIETIIKSFKNGISIDLISSITDLSKEEIVSILQQHGLFS
jgi:predicted transposase/invertase (TIGR01784 family)